LPPMQCSTTTATASWVASSTIARHLTYIPHIDGGISA
jgi:hypothetical protein